MSEKRKKDYTDLKGSSNGAQALGEEKIEGVTGGCCGLRKEEIERIIKLSESSNQDLEV